SYIFQWVKKRFPTQQPCQWLKRYAETIKAAIIGYMSLINIHYANCLKNQYVLRHCCVDDRSDKMGYSAKLFVLTSFGAETASLF
ncbi:hypothetical protein MJM04_34615, partial [Salmonella enterica subsp. enterica serovar Cerro]|nr:hypothetical protein [Salmonella enterica subsp. enterica serovar Cerro]